MGRGRKPKERKGYFYEKEEDAVCEYISTEDTEKKNEIFNKVLLPAFTKMIESIIRRYKLYVPDEDFEQTFNDTISYLMMKITHYKPVCYEYEEIDELPVDCDVVMISESEKKTFFKNASKDSPEYLIVNSDDEMDITTYHLNEKRYKAFSYCQTVCKNYLMFKGIQFVKEQQRTTPYDVVSDLFTNEEKYSVGGEEGYVFAETLIKKTAREIKKLIDSPYANNLNDVEVKVGKSLVELLNNWETHVIVDESNKLQKNRVLYFLREETMMTTKQIRENMKKFKSLYYLLKKKELE